MLWFVWLPLDCLVLLLAYPLAPLIALYADGSGDVSLGSRNVLRLWLTPDNPIEGDEGHVERWSGFVSRCPRFGMYVQRVAWLWRNKAYGWGMKVFNIDVSGSDYVSYVGNPYVSDDPYESGYCFARVSRGFWRTGWMLYCVVPFVFNRCMRLYVGWKMQSVVKDRVKLYGGEVDDIGGRSCMFALSFNPLKSRG